MVNNVFRVLIADDEHWILEGICAMINWEAEGYTICGTAINGIDAEQKILSLQPDLVLADIKMPGQDGLSLLRKIQIKLPKIVFAIISGYAEFNYAREALSIGAVGYILKPIEEDDLVNLLRKVSPKLAQSTIMEMERKIFEDIDMGTHFIRDRFSNTCTLHFQIGGNIDTLTGTDCICQLRPGRYLFVSKKPLLSIDEQLPDNVKGIGVYDCDLQTDDLVSCLLQAEDLAYRFFICPNRKVFFHDQYISISEPLKLFCTAVQIEDYQQAHLQLNLFERLLTCLSTSDIMAIWNATQLFYNGSEDACLINIEALVQRYGTATAMLDAIRQFMRQGFKDEGVAVISIAPYIQSYCAQNISLLDVANHFHMSPSSIQRKIRAEVNCSFQQYLLDCRMHIAKNLLIGSSIKINEIASKCGFEDPLYFRKVFKKMSGLTPTEYRDKNLA